MLRSLALLFLTLIGIGEVSGQVGAGQGRPYDPANPENWEITCVADGRDDWLTWWWVGTIPMSNSGFVVWPVAPGTIPRVHSIGFGTSVGTHQSCGVRRFEVKWVGQSSAPDKVLVEISASAQVHGWNASGAVDNGIGSPGIDLGPLIDPRRLYLEANGTVYRSLPLNGASAILEVRQSVFGQCYGEEGSIDPEIAVHAALNLREKSVAIASDIEPSYMKGSFWPGFGFHREERMRTSMLEFEGDTVPSGPLEGQGPGSLLADWNLQTNFVCDPSGDWTQRVCQWTSPEGGGTGESFVVRKRYTVQEMFDLFRSGPDRLKILLSATDLQGSGGTRTSLFTLDVHAPVDNLVIGAGTVVSTAPRRVTAIVRGPALIGLNAGTTITRAIQLTTSTGCSLDAGSDLLLRAGLSSSLGVVFGETASMTLSHFQLKLRSEPRLHLTAI